MRAFALIMLMLFNSCFATGGTALASGAPVLTVTTTTAPIVSTEPEYMTLFGSIGNSSVLPIVMRLAAIQELPTNRRPANFTIEINSEGGEYDAGFLLTRAIEDSPVPVICVVDGEAASMAFYILQSCNVRIMTRRSMLMAHYGFLRATITMENVDILKMRLGAMNSGMVAHYAKRMKLSETEIHTKLRQGDWWLTADEALRIGAVDSLK